MLRNLERIAMRKSKLDFNKQFEQLKSLSWFISSGSYFKPKLTAPHSSKGEGVHFIYRNNESEFRDNSTRLSIYLSIRGRYCN